MKVTTYSNARSNFRKIIDIVNEDCEPYTIFTKYTSKCQMPKKKILFYSSDFEDYTYWQTNDKTVQKLVIIYTI